jgi:hypothetical protein
VCSARARAFATVVPWSTPECRPVPSRDPPEEIVPGRCATLVAVAPVSEVFLAAAISHRL